MTARRDLEHSLRTYLEDGPTEFMDRSYDAVRDEIDHTRQRVVIGPWREPKVSKFAAFAVAAAAVLLVVAVVGISLGPKPGQVGSAEQSPTPSTAASPSPTPTIGASASPLQMSVGNTSTAMAPGTYVARLPFPLPVTFTVPAGWQGHIPGPNALWLNRTNGEAEVGFSLNAALYADPCHPDEGLLEPSPGPTVEDFAQALGALPGLEATTPTALNVGGYNGLQLTITAPDSFAGCSAADGYLVWKLPLGATYDMVPGEKNHLWVLDVDGQRLVIDAREQPGQTAQERAEVQGIRDSIAIGP
jgi:hypothetical protein